MATKTDATKTPSKASKASKAEHRRPAPTVGDAAGAEFNPARTEEGERVAQTGANPRASRAGIFVKFDVPGQAGKEPISFEVVDGARATLTVPKGAGENLSQADLLTLRATIDRVVQETT